MRLVFGSPWEAQVAIKHWVDCKKAVKYSTGRDDPLCFVRMVPKRFREQQQKLYTIGLQMKQSSEITLHSISVQNKLGDESLVQR